MITMSSRNINTFGIDMAIKKMYLDCDIHQCFAL